MRVRVRVRMSHTSLRPLARLAHLGDLERTKLERGALEGGLYLGEQLDERDCAFESLLPVDDRVRDVVLQGLAGHIEHVDRTANRASVGRDRRTPRAHNLSDHLTIELIETVGRCLSFCHGARAED